MRKLKYIGLTLLSFWLLASFGNTYAHYQGNTKDKNKNKTILKTAADPSMSVIDVNSITAWVQQDGLQPALLGGQSFNGQYPKGSNLGAIYQEGVLWGGQVSDGQTPLVRVGGATYSTGNRAISRLFRVRPDYATADLTDDAANYFQEPNTSVTSGQIDQLRAQYAKDWQEWPGNLGAPYEDKNNDGQYEPNIDVPGVPGASQTLWIEYDDRDASTLYASPPIGMKVQETFWAYAIANPLGNCIFKRVRLIYTGTSSSSSQSVIDSMYIAQFADPDVGQYTDDYAGSDTALNLGYAYNATAFDAKYSAQGLVPPAVGYDFLQGAAYKTGNAADSAIINFKWRKGYKYFQQKPMSGFIYFAAGGNWSDPTLVSNNGNYDNGTLEMYNLLRGYLPSPPYPAAKLFPRPDEFGGPEGGFGTFLVDGDPVTGTGWIDGELEPAGDRRILCINGPITMHLNDTAEIVLAEVGGIGSNNLTSVSVMKYNDIFAQYAYDNQFNLPTFPQPAVTVSPLDQKVVLDWGSNITKVRAIENADLNGYTFEGYNVYQMNPLYPSDLSKAVKIATYDKVDSVTAILDNEFDVTSGLIIQRPVQVGKNTGITRSMTITKDYITNQALYNGQTYYFAVTAYGYNPSNTVPYHALESAVTSFAVVPHKPNPGVRYGSTVGDTVFAKNVNTNNPGDGQVFAVVIDPTVTTGDTYSVTFDTAGGTKTWTLTDETKKKVLLSKETNQSGDDNYYITDGLMVKVTGPSPAIKFNSHNEAAGMVETAYGGKLLTADEYDAAGAEFNGNTVWHSLNSAQDERYYVSAGGGGGTLDRLARSIDNTVGYDFAMKITNDTTGANPDWGCWYFDGGEIGKVPFQLWMYSQATGDSTRLIPILYSGGDGGAGHYYEKGTDPYFGYPSCDWVYWYDDPNGYDAFAAACNSGDTAAADNFGYNEYFARMILCDFDQDGKIAPTGTVIRIYTTKPNSIADKFTFTAPAVTNSPEDAKADVNKINVFPNPYYGYQDRETSREDHYVTFNHLPHNATIRIFDLAGVLVKTLHKSDPSQYTTWTLRNESNYPVASGIYIAYIDMPDLGKTKILKLAIIQEVQVLPVY